MAWLPAALVLLWLTVLWMNLQRERMEWLIEEPIPLLPWRLPRTMRLGGMQAKLEHILFTHGRDLYGSEIRRVRAFHRRKLRTLRRAIRWYGFGVKPWQEYVPYFWLGAADR